MRRISRNVVSILWMIIHTIFQKREMIIIIIPIYIKKLAFIYEIQFFILWVCNWKMMIIAPENQTQEENGAVPCDQVLWEIFARTKIWGEQQDDVLNLEFLSLDYNILFIDAIPTNFQYLGQPSFFMKLWDKLAIKGRPWVTFLFFILKGIIPQLREQEILLQPPAFIK